jgi:hypothetical protein
MADTFYFSRDTKVHLTDSANVVYNIPVLDGFSFSQATNTTEVTINEMTNADGDSRRARQMFTDSYAPAEWSFSTYIRPFATGGAGSGGEHSGSAGDEHLVEEALWNALAGNKAIGTSVAQNNGPGFTTSASAATINFSKSNHAALDTFTLHFEMGSGKALPVIYKIANCVVNEVSVDYDIDGIATAQWSGMGSLITEDTMTTATRFEGTAAADTNNFIRNRLTDLTVSNIETTQTNSGAGVSNSTSVTLSGANTAIIVGQTVTGTGVPADTTVSAISGTGLTLSAASTIAAGATLTFTEAGMQSAYALTLTGGNFTISNNMTFLTPETLGIVNQPLGHVTGTRSVSGSFTCYLNTPGTGSSSTDLFEDIISELDTITNSFGLTFVIGGTGNNPIMTVNMPSCHLEVPTHAIDDLISLETSFHALPSSVDGTDEITLVAVGPNVT